MTRRGHAVLWGMRLLWLILLCLACLSHAQVLRATTPQGNLTAYKNAVALRSPAGHLIWRCVLPAAQITDLQVVAERVLLNVLVSAEHARSGGIAAISLRDGTTLWTALSAVGETPTGEPTQSGVQRGWGVAGNAVWWSHLLVGGGYTSGGTTVFSLQTGGETFRIGGLPFSRQGETLLFWPGATRSGASSPEQLELIFWDTTTDQAQRHNFVIMARPKCGKLLEDPETYQNDLNGPYLTGIRRDACGVFGTRYDWHHPARQTPVILPQN
jgi:hypothetical protein